MGNARETTSSRMTHSLHVLVVDDDRDTADSMAAVVRLFGHEATPAYSGFTAIEVAAECHPNVVLLDLGMPTMDGFVTAKTLRDRIQDVLLVAVSGYGQKADFDRSKEVGFDYHLIKPVNLRHIREILNAAAVRHSLAE